MDSPFKAHHSFSYKVTIPPQGPLGLVWRNCLDFGLLLIVNMGENSPFKQGCKNQFQKQVWIASLHDEEPITVKHVIKK